MNSFDRATLFSSSLKCTQLNLDVYPFSLKIFVYVCMHFCCCSVTKSCPILCDPMDCSMPGFPVLHYSLEFAQSHMPWVNNAIQPSYPLSSPSPPALNLSQHHVFSNESVLHIRWPKYWSFSFSISLSNEYSGLVSYRIDWFDLLAVKRTLKSLL